MNSLTHLRRAAWCGSLLENGFGVTEDGRISCNGIEVPATAVAKAIGSDRRVVDSTAHRILERPFLRDIFLNMRATPDLSKVAESLGFFCYHRSSEKCK